MATIVVLRSRTAPKTEAIYILNGVFRGAFIALLLELAAAVTLVGGAVAWFGLVHLDR